MNKVNKDTLKLAANRLMFDMTDEEYDRLLSEFDDIVQQMNLIRDIECVDEVEPMVFPFEVTSDFLREDEVSDTLTPEEVLRNAKDVKNGMVKIPRVIK